MKIEKEIVINDEPYVATTTGKRKVVLTYEGPRYLYVEWDRPTQKLLVVTHISESSPDMQGALPKLTPIEGREIVEIDAETNTIAAANLFGIHTIAVGDYVEKLENGETWTYQYPTNAILSDVFNFNAMTWVKEKGDYNEYIYHLAPNTDDQMKESVNMIIEKVSLAVRENKDLSEEQLKIVNQYLVDLITYRDNLGKGVENWKMVFPICTIPY